MLLSEVIGQEKLKKQLVDMVQQQRLPHALLLVGPEGSGALPLAVAFAQYIVSIPNQAAATADLFGAPASQLRNHFIRQNKLQMYQRITEPVN